MPGMLGPPARQQHVECAGRPARQRDQAGRELLQKRKPYMGQIAGIGLQPGTRGQTHQVCVAFSILRQEYERATPGGEIVGAGAKALAIGKIHGELTADDRLHASLRDFL